MIFYYDDIVSLKYRIASDQNKPWSHAKSPIVHYLESIDELSDFTDQSEDIFGDYSDETTILEVSSLQPDEISKLKQVDNLIYCVSLLDTNKPTKKITESHTKNGLSCTTLTGFDRAIATTIAKSYLAEQGYAQDPKELDTYLKSSHSYQQLLHVIDIYNLSGKKKEVLQWFSQNRDVELYKTRFPQDIISWADSDPLLYQMNLALASTKAKKHIKSKKIQGILISTDEHLKSDPYQEAWWKYAMWSIDRL